MNLADDKLSQLEKPGMTPDERAVLRCRVASELIHTGKYEAAREALDGLWQGIGKRPALTGLAARVAAEVLLQCGSLTGWLGSIRQVHSAQEQAQDLLTEALRAFESHGEQAKAAEVKYELGLCYFRLGAYDESRIVLDEAAGGLPDTELKAKILIRRASVEIWLSRHHDALRVLAEAQPFFEAAGDASKGRWHGHTALALQRLAIAEGRADYADRAIIEFTAAAYHFERAGHDRYAARALNNLAMLLYRFGRYAEAHENIAQAAAIFARQRDAGELAQVNETRARVLVAEGRHAEARAVIAGVVEAFEKSSEHALLSDALTIQGIIWARLGSFDKSLAALRRALKVAEEAGATSNAGLAALTLIEEHGRERLTNREVHDVFLRAERLLKDTQDAEELSRLRACAVIAVRRLFTLMSESGDTGFSLPKVLRAYEARFIEGALEAEEGSVTRAAKRLGLSHQSLIRILETRHRRLLPKRTPPISRRRSLIKKKK